MAGIDAVIFDFIGTLAIVKDYDLEMSKRKLYKAIVNSGFNIGQKEFLNAYTEAHEKYRIIRYEQLTEVTNAVWISEALQNLGYEAAEEDPRIKIAVNIFFEDYLNSLRLRPCAKKLLEKVAENCKLGLISNFTYAPIIYAGLRKLDINKFFNAVLVSEDVGWRKPHPKIFEECLNRLHARAERTIFVGDSPSEDIKGAKMVGIKTIFIPSQFYSFKNLKESSQKADKTVKSLRELNEKFAVITEKLL